MKIEATLLSAIVLVLASIFMENAVAETCPDKNSEGQAFEKVTLNLQTLKGLCYYKDTATPIYLGSFNGLENEANWRSVQVGVLMECSKSARDCGVKMIQSGNISL